jgi:ABC-type dipeptide/oligopeptide/nickel transport system permease component
MRQALRRILWIGPMLLVASVIAFWAVSRTAPSPPATRPPSGGDVAREALDRFPRFLNRDPRNVRTLAATAMAHVARNDPEAPAAAVDLARLGGAALPHVLPRLDALPPLERSRVARSLVPIALRMQLGNATSLRDPEAAVRFWHRFWEDRSVDFRPAVVRRAVQRVAQDATELRQVDILQFDTYALPDLVEALGSVETREDVARVHRITGLLARVTEQGWHVAEGDSLLAASATVDRYRRWWSLHGGDYQVLDGPRRLLAMVTETAYGKWLSEAANVDLGTTSTGQTVRSQIADHLPVTLWLGLVALIGGTALGVAWGLIAAMGIGSMRGRLTSAVGLALGTFALLLMAGATAPATTAAGSPVAGAATLLLLVAVFTSRMHRSPLASDLEAPHTVAARAFGASGRRIARRALGRSASLAASQLGVMVPFLLLLSLLVEPIFRLPGMGFATVAAAARCDVAWIMAVVLLTVAMTSLGQAASDALLSVLLPGDPAPLGRREEAGP